MTDEEGVDTPGPHFLCPPWSGRYGIEVYSTTRVGGFSEKPYDSLNLGLHVNDDAEQVARNRQRIKEELNFRQEPLWLNQVHGNAIVRAEDYLPAFTLKRSSSAAAAIVAPKADGAWTQQRNLPLAVLTADCLPVVLATSAHSAYAVQPKSIAVVHAGWRGLAADVLQNAISELDAKPASIAAWMGPAIGADAFEVGVDVVDAFASSLPGCEDDFFRKQEVETIDEPKHEGKWLCDLYGLAQRILTESGITEISGGNHCTVRDRDLFYSHRRDGVKSGRQATFAIIRNN